MFSKMIYICWIVFRAPPAQAAASPRPGQWQPQVPTGPRKMRVAQAGEAKSLPPISGGARIPVCNGCGTAIRLFTNFQLCKFSSNFTVFVFVSFWCLCSLVCIHWCDQHCLIWYQWVITSRRVITLSKLFTRIFSVQLSHSPFVVHQSATASDWGFKVLCTASGHLVARRS